MKKIISLLLVLCAVFALASCTSKRVTEINDIVNNSDPTKVVTKVDYVYGDTTLKSSYITEKDIKDGEQRFEYSYQKMAVPGEDDPSSPIKTVYGTVYQDAAGVVTGDTFTADDAPGYLIYNFNLNSKRFNEVNVSRDLKTFEALIPAAEAIRVFGTDISAEGDITLKITTNGEYLYSVYVTYIASGTGATVVINTSYDYTDIAIDLTSESED